MPRVNVSKKLCLSVAGALAVLLCGALPAAAAGTGRYDPGNLGQAIASLVIFVLLLLILRKWAWKPIVKELQRREKDISDALSRAQQREQEATELLTMYKLRLERAESEAQDLLATSRKEAADIRGQIVSTARDEARQGAEKARQALERARTDALRDLRATTMELATEIAEKVIQKKLSPEDHRRLLDESVEEIQRQTRQDEKED